MPALISRTTVTRLSEMSWAHARLRRGRGLRGRAGGGPLRRMRPVWGFHGGGLGGGLGGGGGRAAPTQAHGSGFRRGGLGWWLGRRRASRAAADQRRRLGGLGVAHD